MTRHRWTKLREHVYICRTCGMGRVNAEAHGWWKTTWHKPDGTHIVDTHTPPCAVGPFTEKYLAKYQEQIQL